MTSQQDKPKWLRPWQFGLSTLLLLSTLIAVAVGWWLDRQQLTDEVRAAHEIAVAEREKARQAETEAKRQAKTVRQWLAYLETENDYLLHSHEVVRALNLDVPNRRRVFDGLIRKHPRTASFDRYQLRRREDSLLVFRDTTITKEYESVVVYFSDGEVVDSICHRSLARENHEVEVIDVNDDGVLDVVFHCRASSLLDGTRSFDVVYFVTRGGFKDPLMSEKSSSQSEPPLTIPPLPTSSASEL